MGWVTEVINGYVGKQAWMKVHGGSKYLRDTGGCKGC
jgi:hypothetical protein